MPRIDPPPQYKGDRGPRGFGFILSETEPLEAQVGDLWVDPDDDPTNIIEFNQAVEDAIELNLSQRPVDGGTPFSIYAGIESIDGGTL